MNASSSRTVLRWAGATDVGRVRSNNQDQYLLRPEVQLWVVADGMGGHRGGEVASDLACKEMATGYNVRTVDGLAQAVSAANRVVYETGQADPDLRGMGTTMVALAVVTSDETDPASGTAPGDDVLAIANVGDSRAYRLSGGELFQLTEDHSLVADMVREGRLAPDEAEKHPQKNILTRVLGVYDEIPVDIVTIAPHPGDRYLLCSDGLFNEVPEPEMAAVLRRLDDPEQAADELVRLALANGARDNTTVVIVDVLDTANGGGNAGALSSIRPGSAGAAGAAGGADAHQPGPATQPIGVVTAEPPATLDPSEEVDEVAARGETEGRRTRRSRRRSVEPDESTDGDEPRPKRFTWRVAAFLLLLVALVGGAVATIQWWATATYYVGFEGDQVAIYQGRPGGVLWIDPDLVQESPLVRSDLGVIPEEEIAKGKQHSSRDEADEYVAGLIDEATEYVVAFDGERVAVYEERPGDEPTIVERSELERGDLTAAQRDDLDNGRSFGFRNSDDPQGEATALITDLEDDAEARRIAAENDNQEPDNAGGDTDGDVAPELTESGPQPTDP